jgi:hypothetical protein
MPVECRKSLCWCQGNLDGLVNHQHKSSTLRLLIHVVASELIASVK